VARKTEKLHASKGALGVRGDTARRTCIKRGVGSTKPASGRLGKSGVHEQAKGTTPANPIEGGGKNEGFTGRVPENWRTLYSYHEGST